MKVILNTGDEIEIIGPVVTCTDEGIFISHVEYEAKVKGQPGRISANELQDARFPADVEDQMNRVIDATLPEVVRAWNSLKKFYVDSVEN